MMEETIGVTPGFGDSGGSRFRSVSCKNDSYSHMIHL